MENKARSQQDVYARRQNVERYRRLLTTVTDEGHRHHLQDMLDEEQQKQRDAEDPKYLY